MRSLEPATTPDASLAIGVVDSVRGAVAAARPKFEAERAKPGCDGLRPIADGGSSAQRRGHLTHHTTSPFLDNPMKRAEYPRLH
jgi:hypothetical protein